ncbi:hypothetical protein [Halomonas sp. 3A7M]|nr:hypothetical protein [Halomonas sp. 3A7M]
MGLGVLGTGAGSVLLSGSGLTAFFLTLLLLGAGALIWVVAIVLDAAARHADEVANKES